MSTITDINISIVHNTSIKIMHNPYPKLKLRNPNILNSKSYLPENSFCSNASNPYLTGDIYYSHANHAGTVPELVMNPPRIMSGSMNIGAMPTAASG